MRWRRLTLLNLRMHWLGLLTALTKIEKRSLDTRGSDFDLSQLTKKSILCFMMAVSCFSRGEFDLKEARPKKLAAPMYFDFGWQIYNSVTHVALIILI